MDSPGHTAQYCSYTFMEMEIKKILSLITMDKREYKPLKGMFWKRPPVFTWEMFKIWRNRHRWTCSSWGINEYVLSFVLHFSEFS